MATEQGVLCRKLHFWSPHCYLLSDPERYKLLFFVVVVAFLLERQEAAA